MSAKTIFACLLASNFASVGGVSADVDAPSVTAPPAAALPSDSPVGAPAAVGAPAVVGTPAAVAPPAPPMRVVPVVAPPPMSPAPALPPSPPPYSLPWGLRPIGPVTVLRLDTVTAFYQDPKMPDAGGGTTLAVMPLGGLRITPSFMGVVRWGIIANWPPGLPSSVSVSNPALGGLYSFRFSDFRIGLFLGVTVPIGTGGDKTTDPGAAAATQAGLYARSAMDNAMFAVNDVTVFPGIDLAYVAHRLTLQAEATLLQLMRVKNEAVQTDAYRTNFTFGFHVGYFVAKALSLSAELRYQRWLSTPNAVSTDESLRHNLSLAIGPRFHVKLHGAWFRPGLAYEVGISGTLNDRSYHLLQFDFPFVL